MHNFTGMGEAIIHACNILYHLLDRWPVAAAQSDSRVQHCTSRGVRMYMGIVWDFCGVTVVSICSS